ncbi:hypothetical protein PPYR_10319 [Photinus pyralis]|uniref:Thioredoxin domain-containing protein n=1 Tax=Photinus pyralis TaxID=7054 RepID=A0A5N4AGC2_PHOPY|nr:thioredoxin domain-containing protein 5-like [Photinus pyralis]KAB0796258.1 hypothetical protein PPYR_10319 [Photinus pyralis]
MNLVSIFLISVALMLPLGLNGCPIELNPSNFRPITSQNMIMVKFYTTWCGYCKQMCAAFINLGIRLYETSPVKVGQIDCDRYPQVCNAEGIKSIPTLKYYRQGCAVQYTGERTEAAMFNWLVRNA